MLVRALALEVTDGGDLDELLKAPRFLKIEQLSDLAPAVKRGFASGKPYLINVIVRGSRSPFTAWQIMGKKL